MSNSIYNIAINCFPRPTANDMRHAAHALHTFQLISAAKTARGQWRAMLRAEMKSRGKAPRPVQTNAIWSAKPRYQLIDAEMK